MTDTTEGLHDTRTQSVKFRNSFPTIENRCSKVQLEDVVHNRHQEKVIYKAMPPLSSERLFLIRAVKVEDRYELFALLCSMGEQIISTLS